MGCHTAPLLPIIGAWRRQHDGAQNHASRGGVRGLVHNGHGTGLRVQLHRTRLSLEELAGAALVFSATVISVREDAPFMGIGALPANGPTTVEFKVHVMWKGELPPSISLTTARYDASCGFTFLEGSRYIVYSRDGETVSLCSRTKLIQEADEDLAELGKLDSSSWGPPSVSGARASSQSTSTISPPAISKETPTSPGGGCGVAPSTDLTTGDLALLGLLVGLIAVGRRKRV